MSNDPLIQAITPKTDYYVVLRPFDGDTRFVRGEIVDISGWVHLNRLVENRYIAPLPHGAVLPEPGEDGRRFVVLDDQQTATIPEKKRPTPSRKIKTSV